MKGITYFVVQTLMLLSTFSHASPENIEWPNGAKVAVSLSYDDALHSQLDNALPTLDKYQLKASFYILPNDVVKQRLNEWRTLASNGHELGNHSLFHPCSGALPDREWVVKHHDLDLYNVKQMVEELTVANTLLYAIDGKEERTFTPPCTEVYAGGKDYISDIENQFVAIKGQEFQPEIASIWGPSDVTGEALINHVKNTPSTVKLINIVFHGVGGDHLSVSTAAHEQLVRFLVENKHVYYVDTYINIMKVVEQQRADNPL